MDRGREGDIGTMDGGKEGGGQREGGKWTEGGRNPLHPQFTLKLACPVTDITERMFFCRQYQFNMNSNLMCR